MKVFVTGATGVLGTSAIRTLVGEGHAVSGLARGEDKARCLAEAGATPVTAALFDVAALTDVLRGFDVVCNLATHIPIGAAGLRPRAWRVNDRLRAEGSKAVATAAAAAGVRRLVQESMSSMYADAGEDWIDEDSALCVTKSIESAAVAELNATQFASASRQAVILRFGGFVGDDPMTRWLLARARAGHAIGFGAAEHWAHVIHPEDAGRAVAAALLAPGGVYNAGAEPMRRGDMMRIFGGVVERSEVGFIPKLVVKLAGERLEPLTRSHRVSSQKLHEATGWKPTYDVFDQSWLSEMSES